MVTSLLRKTILKKSIMKLKLYLTIFVLTYGITGFIKITLETHQVILYCQP